MGSCLSTDDNSERVGWHRAARVKRKHRKRQAMEILAAEAKSNELLSRMPGRMCANGATSNACIFTQQGRKGTNQDAMVVWESFGSRTNSTFCGVFDGHGPFGHLVARKVRDSLPSKLTTQWKAHVRGDRSKTTGKGEGEPVNAAGDGVHATQRSMSTALKESFLKAYSAMDKELRTHPTIDCFCSGTTAVTMLLEGQDLVIGNVGDSRAILGTLRKDDTLEAVQLTVDLKPNLPLEAERIKRCRGRVFALEDEPEVARVWLPHDDSPGLAMARAFGDFCLKEFGLIAVPEVSHRRMTERDQFVVLASDGIWDVLSNEEVAEVIWTAPTRMTAARAVVETAVRAWRLKYPTSKVDDCAVVCLYLNDHRRHFAEAPPSFAASAAEQEKIVEADEPQLERSNTVRSISGSPTSDPSHPDPLPVAVPTTLASISLTSCSRSSPPAPTLDTVSPAKDDKVVERSTSRRSLAECLSAEDDDWSALEGVTRVNSLLNLPRFLLVGEKRTEAGSATRTIKRRT